ncbi:MAG TPA: HAD-IIA family hydrolase [Acidobacteriota bacterium]|nr:HAD-IIA family hydrolase [Acidobacteriota bacterium]HNR39551.1 HAD-IIA family hydrolase [Acidobacteriota bacterium]HNU01602.1 HAD-IIA family hydrolase [Acidobacteriota bacterium]HPB28996.1 HAD-IIA family hydrolase [Acidobacteriota bacterium]HQO26619.1 HAD-IIA family hydrolase [Acidobacteriota bacterium]
MQHPDPVAPTAGPAAAPAPRITCRELIATYDVVLLDAYGVLLDADGPLPGARALLADLRAAGREFYILTNDASRTVPETEAAYRRKGLDIPAARIITSGSLLPGYFVRHALAGRRCAVLGPEGSRQNVAAAGGVPVDVTADADADVLVVCDETGYPFLETVDAALSLVWRALDRRREIHLLLPNPDLIFPKGGGRYGLAAGSIALCLEAALRLRYDVSAGLAFRRLGKPHPEMFAEAARRAGGGRMIMIGDQLETDIRGAIDFGIDAALVGSGVTRPDDPRVWPVRPTCWLPSLADPGEPGTGDLV